MAAFALLSEPVDSRNDGRLPATADLVTGRKVGI